MVLASFGGERRTISPGLGIPRFLPEKNPTLPGFLHDFWGNSCYHKKIRNPRREISLAEGPSRLPTATNRSSVGFSHKGNL